MVKRKGELKRLNNTHLSKNNKEFLLKTTKDECGHSCNVHVYFFLWN